MHLSSSEKPSRRAAKGGKSPRVLVIYNPAAGQWRKRRLQTTLAALKGLGCAVHLFATQKALLELAKNGTPIVASEAVLGNSVPDATAQVKASVARAMAPQADQH